MKGKKQQRYAMLKRWGLAASAIMLVAAVATGCSAGSSGAEAAAAGQAQDGKQAKEVKVAPIAKQQIAEAAVQVADVEASAQIDVMAKTGADVKQVIKHRGDEVKKGDVLVKLDDTDAALNVKKAQLGVQSAQDQLTGGRLDLANNRNKLEQALSEAAKALNKAKNDYNLGLITDSQLNQAENAYANTKNELDALNARSDTALRVQLDNAKLTLEQAQRALDFCTVRAPVSGTLTDMTVQEGMTVNAGFRIGQIQALNPVKIVAQLTPQAAGLVRGKSALDFQHPGESRMYTGKIAYLADVMNTQTGSYALELSASNEDRSLKPGEKVQVVLSDAAEQKALAVPTLSIARVGTDTFVFVVNGNKAERRKVELGRVNGLMQEVLSGVKEGEKLVVSGQNQLQDGDAVTIAADAAAKTESASK